MQPDPAIDRKLLDRLIAEVSAFGATSGGGLNRLCASPEDGAARDWLKRLLAAHGCRVLVDRVGNMFGLLDLAGPHAPLVLAGSHLDSQPHGGRYDGAYGVVAAAVAAFAVAAMARRADRAPRCNLAVVNWTNEEGARFAPSTLGSNVYAGRLDPAAALAATDAGGITLGAALAAIGYAGTDEAPLQPLAYLEAHIEQGPHLEKQGKTIGVVEGNWGTVKYEVTCQGRAAHTGPTPMRERRDALLPAAALVLFVRELSDETGGALLSSVGRIDVTPNSTNVVAASARIFVEFRAVEASMLARACARFEDRARALEGDGIRLAVQRTVDRAPGRFDARLARLIEQEAGARGLASMRLHTIAGHDAVPLAAMLPSAMLFVPSAGGISHNEAEFTRPEDLQAGADVLAGALARLVWDGLPS
ncbi:MAG: Zn-dependent hydrolase [Alphaproteobacteria bacterium]|nr:Zn-dependent hydrolase [Alphaproteobacteria bacterium]